MKGKTNTCTILRENLKRKGSYERLGADRRKKIKMYITEIG
jgi:hypothetical protein